MRLAPLLLCLPAIACSTQGTPVPAPIAGARTYHFLELPNLDDNVKHDTLLVYTTHALGNGEFVMAARNVEETRDGLRLYLYRPLPDSSADVIASSSPAYDSYTMLPTFFTTGDTADGTIILANLGEKQSWGQKVFWLKDRRFIELGFLDVARREFRTEYDSTFSFCMNIAPYTEVAGAGGLFDLTFKGDSVLLYDDLAGGSEVMMPSGRVRYRYNGRVLQLVIDGRSRSPKSPA